MQERQIRKNRTPRERERPRVCPKCKSAYWDVARKLGTITNQTTYNLAADNRENKAMVYGRRTKPHSRRKIGFTLFRDYKTKALKVR